MDRNFLWAWSFWGVLFFPENVGDLLVVVTFTQNVQTSKQLGGKNLAADRGPLAAGSPFHGTTGTMVNPALTIGS